MALLGWQFEKNAAKRERPSVAIVAGQEALTLVAFDVDSDWDAELEERPRISAWETTPYADPADRMAEIPALLTRFVAAHDLSGSSCRCVLGQDAYSLRLVERPPGVAEEELVDATRWLVRDLIEFDLDRAELAILTIPEDDRRARTARMFVVAARHEPMVELAAAVEHAGLRLAGFEIIESAMLGLESVQPSIVTGGAALRLDEKASVLTLSCEDHLYLARNLNLDLAVVDEAATRALTEADPASAEIVEALDELLLDLQRSLDYYESEHGLAPASRLTLLPCSLDVSPLVPALGEALRPVRVEALDLNDRFDFAERPPHAAQQALAIALGAGVVRPDLIGGGLIPGALRPSMGGLGLREVVRLVAAASVILAICFGFARFQLGAMRAELAELETQTALAATELEASRAALATAPPPVDPETQLANLRARRDARISLLRDMTARRSRTDVSFASLLAGLARQDREGIWLERIAFSNGGEDIELEGRVERAKALPAYLRRLGDESSFANRRFRTLAVERAAEPTSAATFRIATREAGEDRGAEGGVGP